MTADDTLRKIDAFWAGYFGVRPEDLSDAKTLAVTHAALEAYDGALAFRHGKALIVSVPDQTPEIERQKLRAAKPDEAFEPKFLAKTFVISTDKVSGPAWVGIADKGDFTPGDNKEARLLTKSDSEAIRKLAEGCGEATWKQSKLALDREPNLGLFVNDELVAVSGYIVMGDLLAYIGVVTHPEHRGKGHARAVVTAGMQYAFDRGLCAMWRTPQAHESAVHLAQTLGFKPYASTYDIQLTEDEF